MRGRRSRRRGGFSLFPRRRKWGLLTWLFVIVAGGFVYFFFIAKTRPAWLGKIPVIGKMFGGGAAAGAIASDSAGPAVSPNHTI